MFNLIKFEWKKMSSYRNISIAMIIILGIVTIITQNNNNDYEIFSILIIGSVSATLAFLIVGTILNTKSDIDDSSSIGLYVPKSGVSIFASKIINITLHFIIFIIIFFIVMGLKEIINDNSVLNDIPSLITSAYPEIFLSYLDYAIILLVYICLLYISLLITKSITGRTNVLYVLLVFIAITFIITIIAKSLNHYLGLVYDLKTMNIVNMNTSNSYIFELDKSNTIMTNTFLEHNFDNPDNNILYLSYGVYLPSLIISIFTIIFSNLLGGYLIDNKIDF